MDVGSGRYLMGGVTRSSNMLTPIDEKGAFLVSYDASDSLLFGKQVIDKQNRIVSIASQYSSDGVYIVVALTYTNNLIPVTTVGALDSNEGTVINSWKSNLKSSGNIRLGIASDGLGLYIY